MALNSSSLKSKIETQLRAQGFELDNEHCVTSKLAQAIANAVIDEITSNGQVIIAGGSSSGAYKIT